MYNSSQSGVTTPTYIPLNTLPSSSNIRITCPRLPGATQDHEMLNVTIAYRLCAVLYTRQQHVRRVIAETVSEVHILDDSLGALPPTCVLDFGSEYDTQRIAKLRTSEFSALRRVDPVRHGSLPRILIQASEPQHLLLCKASQYATTAAPVTINLRIDKPLDQSNDLKCTVDIGWRLKRSTFCAFDGLAGVPTVQQVSSANRPTAIQRKVVLGPKHTYKHDVYFSQSQKDMGECLFTEPETDLVRTNSFGHQVSIPGDCSSGSVFAVSPENRDSRCEDSIVEPNHHTASEHRALCPPYARQSADLVSWEDFLRHAAVHHPVQPMTIMVPVYISRDMLPTPTSFTPYAAVRYSLQIHVAVTLYPAETSRAERANLSLASKIRSRRWYRHIFSRELDGRWTVEATLEVPIQVVYDRTPVVSDTSQASR